MVNNESCQSSMLCASRYCLMHWLTMYDGFIQHSRFRWHLMLLDVAALVSDITKGQQRGLGVIYITYIWHQRGLGVMYMHTGTNLWYLSAIYSNSYGFANIPNYLIKETNKIFCYFFSWEALFTVNPIFLVRCSTEHYSNCKSGVVYLIKHFFIYA